MKNMAESLGSTPRWAARRVVRWSHSKDSAIAHVHVAGFQRFKLQHLAHLVPSRHSQRVGKDGVSRR
jgi:hypothetical protein